MSKLKSSYSTTSLRDNLSNLYQDLDKHTLYSSILSLRLNSVLEMQKNEMHSSIFGNSQEIEDSGFVSRLSLVENLVKDLKMYNFVPSIKKFIDENEQIFEENKLEISIEKTLFSLKNDKNSKFYEKAIADLKESSKTEDPLFSIVETMKQHSWIPSVKNLYEFANSLKGSLSGNNPNFRISKIYSPVDPINESNYRFYSTGKVLTFDGSNITESNDSVSDDFKFLVSIVESSRITDNNIRFLFNNSILDITFGEEKKAFVNNNLVESKNLRDYLISSALVPYGDKNKITIFERALETGSDIKEIDLGYKVSSNLYEGLSCSVFLVNDQIFIQKVNRAMNENSIVKADSAKDAVSIVKNFMNFDISESIKKLIYVESSKEEQRLMESKKLTARINFLLEKLSEVDSLELEIGKSEKLTEAKNILKKEIAEHTNKLRVLEGVETPFSPNPAETSEPSMIKLKGIDDLVAGKEYTIDGKGGYMYQGVSDGNHIFNQKDETNPTPIHMNSIEADKAIVSGKITK